MRNILNQFIRKRLLEKRKHFVKRNYDIKQNYITILSSNCLGGFIYHDINSQFISPTINLTFDSLDFIHFLENLASLNKTSLSEYKENKNQNYPIGLLCYPDGSKIKIYFVHYKSFKEAKDKFYMRVKRINFDNVCILFTTSLLTSEIYQRFIAINYKKVCFYKETTLKSNIIDNEIFVNAKKVLDYKKDAMSFCSPFGRKLVFDKLHYDYYEFIGFEKKRNKKN